MLYTEKVKGGRTPTLCFLLVVLEAVQPEESF